MKHLLLFCLLLVAVRSGAQTTIYVDSSVSASGAGTSWNAAYKTLNEALNAANGGSGSYLINIAKGTYYAAGVQSSSNRDSAFCIVRDGIRLYGGYPSGGGTRNISGYPTMLSGNIGAQSSSTDNSYHVMVLSGVFSSDSVILDGLKITGGYANGTGTSTFGGNAVARNGGGGIYMVNMPASLAYVNQCAFSGDSAIGNGGALYLDISEVMLDHCNLTGNAAVAGNGGAVYASSTGSAVRFSGITASYTTFSGNTALLNGGAISISGTAALTAPNFPATINNCLFSGNSAGSSGGAVYSFLNKMMIISQAKLSSNKAQSGGGVFIANDYVFLKDTFALNAASLIGGGARTANAVMGSTRIIDTCLFIGNKSGTDGGGIYLSAASATISNSAFTADSAGGAGGAVYAFTSIASGIPFGTLERCTFQLNNATQGGGLYLSGNVDVRKSTMSGNSALQCGGGIFCIGSGISNTIENSRFSGNKAGVSGGGLYDSSGLSKPQITFCTFAGDTALNGNGIYNTSSATLAIINSIIWEGASSIVNANSGVSFVTYSIVQSGQSGIGNSLANPLFMAPASSSLAPTVAGGYHLYPCSPAIDAGQSLSGYLSTKDLQDSARLFGSGFDMGAYETQPTFPSPVTGGTSVCTNGTLQLSNRATGGTWSSSNPSLATVSSAGLVTGSSPGTDTIIYSAISGPCSMTVMHIITVSQAPAIAPITGRGVLCQKDTTHLTTTITGGNWISTNNTVATISFNTGVVKGVTGGIDTVKYYISNAATGCISEVTQVIIVNDTPRLTAITGIDSICNGSTTLLANTATGGAWASADTTKALVSNAGIVTGLANGSTAIIYTVTNSNGCVGTKSRLITVTDIDNAVTQTGPRLTADQAGASYQWLDCGGGRIAVAGQTSQTFNPTVNGQYAVAIALNGCTDTSACISVTNVGISSRNPAGSISVYPNPASGTVRINVTGATGNGKILLRDISGKLLKQQDLKLGIAVIDISQLSIGVYVVEAQVGGLRYQERLTIVR